MPRKTSPFRPGSHWLPKPDKAYIIMDAQKALEELGENQLERPLAMTIHDLQVFVRIAEELIKFKKTTHHR